MKVYLIRCCDELAVEGDHGVERIFLTEKQANVVLEKDYKSDKYYYSWYVEEWEVEE